MSKSRFLLVALVSLIVLILQLSGYGREAPTWAAPGQNPHMQTVPTRPPTRTPTPSPEPIFPTPTVEQPGEDEDDESTATHVVEEDAPRPSPGPVIPRTPIGSLPTTVPLGTVAAPTPDYAAATPPGTISGAREYNSASSSVTESTPTLASSPSSERVQLLSSPAPVPVSIEESKQPSKIAWPSYWAGSPCWLCAGGLGVLLILAGVILVRRSQRASS